MGELIPHIYLPDPEDTPKTHPKTLRFFQALRFSRNRRTSGVCGFHHFGVSDDEGEGHARQKKTTQMGGVERLILEKIEAQGAGIISLSYSLSNVNILV